MDVAVLESVPAEMKDFAELLSSEQVGRVMQCVQDAYTRRTPAWTCGCTSKFSSYGLRASSFRRTLEEFIQTDAKQCTNYPGF